MKECPVCRRCFPDHVNHCPDDGDATTSSISGEPVLDGRYQLERRLGHGGMGVVYQARHIFLKTAHAIKVILPDLVGNDPMLITRFRQEALAAAAIRHQNIIAVTDFGVVRGTMPFLVMEFVSGKSLHDILAEEGALPPARALEIISAVGAGVAAAHRQGIVHRDLKPLNIMFQEDMPIAEAVKVLDFGLAKIKSGELLGSFIQAKTSGLMGSPFYMAPEQWGDEEPDARADIYSLGVMLFQMLGGDVPFKGTSIPSIMKKHLTAAPPTFASMGIQVPPQIEAVVRHALEKEAENRPASVEDFINELRDAVASLTAALKRTSLGTTTAQAQTIIGTSTGNVSMPPATTTLRIRTRPPNSRVYVNNVSVGVTSDSGELVVRDMLRGVHRVHVIHDNYQEWSRQIECETDVCEIEAQLKDLSQANMPQASVIAHQSFSDPYSGTISSTSLADESAPYQSHAAMEAQRLRQQADALEERARREEAEQRGARERLEQEERERLAREEAEREEQARLQAEARRREEEAARLQAEAEARRKAEEEEAARLRAAEEEKRRLEEEKRLAAEAAKRRAQEEERERLRAEEEERRKAEEEAARQKAAAAAAAEEARRAAEAQAARLRAEEEKAARLRAEEEERRRVEEEKRLAAEAAAAAEEARLRAEEKERLRLEDERRRREEEETKARAAEEEAARLRAEEERQREQERERLATEKRERAAREQREREEKAARIAETIHTQRIEPSDLETTAGQRQGIITQNLGQDSLSGDAEPAVDWQQGQSALPRNQAALHRGRPSQESALPGFAGAEPKKSGLSTTLIAAIIGVVLVGGGLGAWFMLGSRSNELQANGNASSNPETSPTATNTPSPGESPAPSPGTTPAPPPVRAELISVPGGLIQIGRSDGTAPEVPTRSVTVRPFSMDKTEVTNAEYAEFVRDEKYTPPSHWSGDRPAEGTEQLPVVNVSYQDAVKFAAWRSKRDGVTYRLPTEEEWEYAARGGDQGNLYPWGNTWVQGRAGTKDSGATGPKPVGSYAEDKSRWGILDMAGNVYEWTSSKASYYPGSEFQVRPEHKNWIIVRGGAYVTDHRQKSPSTFRDWFDPSRKEPMIGFRLVRPGS